MSPELIAAVITGGVGAFTGLSRALNNFNRKVERRFERIEDDFLREMESVHTKLDRILDHLLAN